MDPTLWLHFLFLFCQDPWLTGSLSPYQGWNLCPLQQKHVVLTIRPPGKSLHVVKPYINGVKMYIIETSLVVQWVRYWAPNAGDPGSISGQGTRSHMLQRRPSAVKWIKRKMYIIMQINKLRIPLILWPFPVYFFFFFFPLSQLNFCKEKSHLACFHVSALILSTLLQPGFCLPWTPFHL